MLSLSTQVLDWHKPQEATRTAFLALAVVALSNAVRADAEATAPAVLFYDLLGKVRDS